MDRVIPHNPDYAGVRPDASSDHFQKGRFPGPVRPQQGDDLTGLNRYAEVINNLLSFDLYFSFEGFAQYELGQFEAASRCFRFRFTDAVEFRYAFSNDCFGHRLSLTTRDYNWSQFDACPQHSPANSLCLSESDHAHWYSTARVSKRLSVGPSACLRGRYPIGVSENGRMQSHKRTKPLPNNSRSKNEAQGFQPLNITNWNGTVFGFPWRKDKYEMRRTIGRLR